MYAGCINRTEIIGVGGDFGDIKVKILKEPVVNAWLKVTSKNDQVGFVRREQVSTVSEGDRCRPDLAE
jgi:hypothetical protein